ncbi:MAG TPA: hypothetical protein VKT49_22510 [Bryobacteraceae bacterium]|nr:hypothetical protein [Bryobacteraceae bacterium]
MTRRGLLCAATARVLRADDAQDIWNLFTEMAAALSDGKVAEFMKAFVPAMPGYDTLRLNVEALLASYELQSSIELIKEEGDAAVRTIELDWFLQIVEKLESGSVTRRREQVRCRLVKQKKRWRIASFEPLSLFKPVA